jgi:lipid II:glycine glycyltransferase (peptidoglycan interpeptide bridge formation enzyme)
MDLSSTEWDTFLAQYPNAHLLQTTAWGEHKAGFEWEVERLTTEDSGAQILFRRLLLGYTLAYIPKGPIGDQWKNLWPEVDKLCRRKRAVFLKVEPDLWEGTPAYSSITGGEKCPQGFRLSPDSIQPTRTLLVDLSGDEETILAQMKQKTRYNIKLALKKGVIVRPSADLETFHRLSEVTGERDRFGVHSLDYYRRAYDLFHSRCACELFMAEYEGEPLAALMVFAQGQRAWFLYGASSNEHRDRMPTYLLQWEAMRWARAQGCVEYDLWGVPDADEETLEANFALRNDGLWGVYRFKRGFGGKLCRAAGPWDRVYQPAFYMLYHYWLRVRKADS